MAKLESAIPVRWTGGPLEIAVRGKAGQLGAEARRTLERFHEPASLSMFEGSPIDCLVVSWACGLPEDAAQQKSIGPLLDAARKRNLATVGWVTANAAADSAIAAAKSSGLDALVIEKFAGKSDYPVIPCCERP